MTVPRKQIEDYFYGDPESIAPRVLLIKRENRLPEYEQYLTGVCEFGNVWKGITGFFHGERVSVIAAGIGPSMVGDAVYAIDRPKAVCLYSGTCGGVAEGRAAVALVTVTGLAGLPPTMAKLVGMFVTGDAVF